MILKTSLDKKKMKKVGMMSIFLFGVSLIVNSQVVDPEIQRYFEKNYGYLKGSELRDSPISVSEKKGEKLKEILITYTRIPQPDYSEIPLHYDLKKQNTTGALSYYVTPPQEKGKIKTYTAVDVTVAKRLYEKALKELSSNGFILAGEETSRESEYVVVFGWIEDSYFERLIKINGVERIALSTRNIKAPQTKLLITLKVPNNRNIPLFIDRFTQKLAEYGFSREDIEIVSEDKRYRFSVIKIRGTIPIDKTKLIIKSPFVIEIDS